MNTTQLETFLTVADTLSFARAAERLHVTQPAVTHQIKSLEAELGVSLFTRTTRRVRLTEEGRMFMGDAEAMVSTARRARGRFRSGAAEEPLRLTVGVRSFAHGLFLGEVFGELVGDYPTLHPDLVVVPHEHLHQLLEDGEVEVVLDFEGTGGRAETFTQLIEVESVVLCPDGSPLRTKNVIGPQDLAGQPLALARPEHIPQPMRAPLMSLAATLTPDRFYRCDSVEAAAMLVRAGIASTVLPELSLPPDAAAGAVPFGATEPVPFGAYTLGAPAEGLVTSFVELAGYRLRDMRRPR